MVAFKYIEAKGMLYSRISNRMKFTKWNKNGVTFFPPLVEKMFSFPSSFFFHHLKVQCSVSHSKNDKTKLKTFRK